jgi:tetratricopeptide (TPR) repeat protein
MDSVPPAREQVLATVREAMGRGMPERAAAVLKQVYALNPGDAEVGRLLGFALRGAQRLDEAQAVFEMLPGDPVAKLGRAQTAYERGLPAAALFSDAQTALPGELEVLRNRAAALLSEGEGYAAEGLLRETLAIHPGWLDGHKALATLRWTGGDSLHFAESYASAVLAQPRNSALWLAWFATVAQTRAWASASDILDRAEAEIGKTAGILASRFFLASESGDMSTADALFVSTLGIEGDATSLTRLRYLIRRGRFADAEALALRLTATPSGTLFWPWLSLIWRLSGDARHLWLDNPDVFIRSVVVDLSAANYAELAGVLRGLHVMQRPYVEQSVRGGTQTDRSVMLRHEPILQKTRSAWIDAIRGYVATMPPFEAEHPLLGTPREQLLIEGSWSVRLLCKGHNVPHTHPRGWLSTAFYIALPDADVMGPVPAGHIAFGTPPDGLGIDLPPYRTIAPVVGQSAVFPSTMWHSTVPFDDGERLVLALDVRRPTY